MSESAPIGRPSDYRPEYCEMLIKHMASGLSFESFAGVVGVARSTVYKWADDNPAFSDAKEKGFAACQLHWEQIGQQGLWSGGKGEPNFNVALWIYNVKCRFPKSWHDAKVAQDAGVIETPPIVLNYQRKKKKVADDDGDDE